MTDWNIHGREFVSCNCDYGCPCQFGWPKPTLGYCESVAGCRIERGHFGDTPLDGLHYATIYEWPGAIHEGNGTMLAVIEERADGAQREALRKILHGEDTEPGATHYYIFHSTMTRVLDPIYAPIEFACDVEARTGRLAIPGVVEARGEPIRDEVNGTEHRARIDLPNGFEYKIAEIGRSFARTFGEIEIQFDDTYGQFNEVHTSNRGILGRE
jgi:hypothetical protein